MMPIAHFSTGFDDQMGHQKFISQIEPSMPLLFESGKQDVFQIQPEALFSHRALRLVKPETYDFQGVVKNETYQKRQP